MPLASGAKGAALLLAKHLLTIRVQGQDICPLAPTVLNIRQFMMWDEVRGEVDNTLWFEVYFHTLQSGGGSTWLAMAVAEGKGMRGCSFSHSKSFLGGNRCGTHRQLYQTLLGAPAKSGVQEKGEGCCLACDHLPRQHGCVYSHAQHL